MWILYRLAPDADVCKVLAEKPGAWSRMTEGSRDKWASVWLRRWRAQFGEGFVSLVGWREGNQ